VLVDDTYSTKIAETCLPPFRPSPHLAALLLTRTLPLFLPLSLSLSLSRQDLECWGPEKHTGVWRLLLVRHNSSGGALLLVQYSTRNCQEPERAARLAAALVKLKEFVVEEAKRTGLDLVSLFVQEHNEVGNRALDSTPVQLVDPQPHTRHPQPHTRHPKP